MRVIRASEISTYLFCNRAWWYQLQGYEPGNKTELTGGLEIHHKYSRVVRTTNYLQVFAYTSLLIAILLAIIWILQTVL